MIECCQLHIASPMCIVYFCGVSQDKMGLERVRAWQIRSFKDRCLWGPSSEVFATRISQSPWLASKICGRHFRVLSLAPAYAR